MVQHMDDPELHRLRAQLVSAKDASKRADALAAYWRAECDRYRRALLAGCALALYLLLVLYGETNG